MADRIEGLIQALRSEDVADRIEAARKLSAERDPSAINPLVVALLDPEEQVRIEAAKALSQIGEPAVDFLIQMMKSKKMAVGIVLNLRELRLFPDHLLYQETLSETLALIEQVTKPQSTPSASLSDLDLPAFLRRREREEGEREKARPAAEPPGAAASPPQADSAAAPPAPSPAPAVPPRDQDARGGAAAPLFDGIWMREQGKEESQQPQFSAFYPDAARPGQAYALMAFAHLESARDQVREIAAGYADKIGGPPKRSTAPGLIKVEIGNLLTFVPDIPGIRFNPAEQVITWQPPYQSAIFFFTAPASLSADLAGRVVVYHGPLIVGEIPVSIKALPADASLSTPATQEGELHRYDPVFASYSHRDTPVMEYFRRTRATLGQKMLVDIYDLRAGEHWSERLLEMIDQSAAFQLFWSDHSAQSNYCRQEWEYALRYVGSRPRFIQPVWWDAPMPSPPDPLAGLHFQKVALPPLTRMQLAMARVRTLFGRSP